MSPDPAGSAGNVQYHHSFIFICQPTTLTSSALCSIIRDSQQGKERKEMQVTDPLPSLVSYMLLMAWGCESLNFIATLKRREYMTIFKKKIY